MNKNEEETWEDWEDFDGPVLSIFNRTEFVTGQEAIEYDKIHFEFNLELIKNELSLDLYGLVKVVNWARENVSTLEKIEPLTSKHGKLLQDELLAGKSLGDEYLKPFLQDDALLFSFHQLAFGDESDEGSDIESKPYAPTSRGDNDADEVNDNQVMQISVSEYASMKKDIAYLKEHVRRNADHMRFIMEEDVQTQDNDTYYFSSYDNIGIHETMLKDAVRTGAYKNAMIINSHLFKGKKVLDVGCGTGILSMFAASAGAAIVIGVDMSDIIHKAREVIKLNGLSDTIQLLQGKIEDIELPVDEFDVIISEWMGYCLFYESMMPSLLYARDRYMGKDGIILPNRTPMYIEGMVDSENCYEFWNDVYGFDFSPLKRLVTSDADVRIIECDQIITDRVLLRDFDAMTLQNEDLDFCSDFILKVSKASTNLMAMVISFDVGFTERCSSPIWFSTGPKQTPTHWKQTILWLNDENQQKLMVGDSIAGSLRLSRNEKNPRELDLYLEWKYITSSQISKNLSQNFKVR